jgi:hypothetical protein
LISAQRTGIEADPRAGRLFRLAAVRLSTEPADSEGQRAAATEAAAALVGLTLAEAEDELRELLTPDPADHNVVWTVACYQIGDLTPSALRDFPDPVEAMATVAACPDETHVAAELVASTSGGLRWTAVLRTNDHLAVQLPTPETSADGSRERPGDLAAALRRWRERLAAWSENGGDATDDERALRPQVIEASEAPPSSGSTSGRSPMVLNSSAPSLNDDRFSALERRMAGIEVAVNTLSTTINVSTNATMSREIGMGSTLDRRDLEAVEQSIGSRLARLESVLASITAGLEAANTAAARRDESVRQLELELVTARSSNSSILARQDLEVLQGIIDLRFRALAACFNEALARFEDVAGRFEQRTVNLGDDVTTTVRRSVDDIRHSVHTLEQRVLHQLSLGFQSTSGAVEAGTETSVTRENGVEWVSDPGDGSYDTTRRLRELAVQIAGLTSVAVTKDAMQAHIDALRAELPAMVEPAMDNALATVMASLDHLVEATQRTERADVELHQALFGTVPGA